MRNLALMERQFELSRQCNEFSQFARLLLMAKGDPFELAELAKDSRTRAGMVIKTAVEAGSIGASTSWGSQFQDYGLLAAGFAQALANYGLFDQLLGSMKRVPLGTATVGAISVAAQSYVTSEGSAKPITRVSLTNAALTPEKAAAVVALSVELLRAAPDAQRLVTNELIAAAALAIDTKFLATATSGISVATSSGPTSAAFRADLAGLLAAVTVGAQSKLFLATTATVAKNLSVMGTLSNSGEGAFPQMGPQGGTVSQIPVIVSDAVSAGQVVLIDADGFAGAVEEARLQMLREGSINLDTSPDSPISASTQFQSFWQMDMAGLVCERRFGCQRLRNNAVAIVSNTNSWSQGYSPP